MPLISHILTYAFSPVGGNNLIAKLIYSTLISDNGNYFSYAFWLHICALWVCCSSPPPDFKEDYFLCLAL